MGTIEKSASTPQLDEIITEDGILCLILSFLNLKEAVRTSVLSSRWRHIWTHLTKFDFDAVSVLGGHTLGPNDIGGEEAYNITKGKTDEFIQSVNSVLQHLQDTKLDTFAVRHYLNKSHSQHLDAWVRFAVASKARVLSLLLFRPVSNSRIELYDFPCHLLGSSSFIHTLTLISCTFYLPNKFDGLRHLTDLYLFDVDINEDDLNCILSNCCNTLINLDVVEAPQLVAISVRHPLSQLEILTVRSIFTQLMKIELNAVNLIKLTYQGAPVDFRFIQSSKLNDAHICFETNGTVHNMDFYLTRLSRSLPHLQSLNLNISNVSQVVDLPKCPRRYINLTRLELKWDVSVEMSILDLATLLRAAPFLQELKLHFSKCVLEQQPEIPRKQRETLPKQPHIHLKMIKVSGFYFETWQIGIVVYLLQNAIQLKSLKIEKVCEFRVVSKKSMGRAQRFLAMKPRPMSN